MPLRDEWCDLARKLDWSFSYADERQVYPETKDVSKSLKPASELISTTRDGRSVQIFDRTGHVPVR